ncbi:MAG TPA: PAS domain S-box protein [Pyrinomonadaceae bacterium]|nr:PAS domain S-box protein [Pyrinomonadaceae bacterium]
MKDETPAPEDLQSKLLDASVDGLLAFDAEFRYTAWNSAMERISGMPREQVVGRVAFEVFPFLVETGEDKYFRDALAGRTVVAEARPYDVPESGHKGFFDGYYSPLRDESGRVTGGVGVVRDITAQKVAEDALRAGEERYRAFISNSSEGIWRFELDEPVPTELDADAQIELFYQHGHLAECNDAMARMYGYEHAVEIVGARMGDLLVRTDPANVEYLRAFVASGYRLTDVESVERDREGNLKFFSNNLVGVVEAGRVLRGWGTQRDVTDRRLAENAMRVSEERLRRAQQAARLGTWDWDLRSGAVVWSEGIYELLGIEFGSFDANFERWKEFVLPEDTEVADKLMEEVLARGGDFSTEFRVRRADGEVRWLASIGRVETDEGGSPRRALGVNIDVTERKRTEEEGRRLAAIIEATTDFVAVSEAESGAFIYVNRAGRSMVGLTEDGDLTGLRRGAFAPEWAHERTQSEWLPKALDEGSATGEGALRTLEGQEIPVSFVLLVHRDASGEPRYVSTVARDIQERKRAEAERELLLAREQSARMQAEEANRLKDEFLATLSHELRTPLTAVLGWAHMLKTGGLDDATARHAIETVERNAQVQRQLVEDVLDVSRIVTGKLRIEQTAVQLLDVVQAALDSVRPAAEAKRIQLQCSFDPRAGSVAGDPSRLQQVVWNLLSNAVKFTPAGGVVKIGVERLLAQTRITVSDTGQGIAPDFLPYVFDRFRQADGSTTRLHGGLGLGLAIVRHLVEAHGGSVHAYSAGAGAGATFTVDLPPLPGDAIASPESRVLKTAERAGEARGAGVEDEVLAPPLVGLRVLLVDDDEDAMEMLAAFLGRSGAEVKTATSAAAALKELGVRAFDVIVSDIAMPVVDGYELMRRVRALDESNGGQTPSVALTAYAGDSDRAQALRSGFQRHLAKPVEPGDLLEVIADLAGKQRTT